MNQSTLTLREYNGIQVPQRPDGYFNATKMCQAGDKKWNDFLRLKSSQGYITALASVAGIPATDLVNTVQGGDPQLQGTWIHPRLASRLAQWISPEFAVVVDGWVIDILEGRQPITQPQPLIRHSPPEQRLNVIERGVALLDRLGGLDDATRIALKDEVRSIVLNESLGQPEPSMPKQSDSKQLNITSTANEDERIVIDGGQITIAGRAAQLGYELRNGQTLAIASKLAILYQQKHQKDAPVCWRQIDGVKVASPLYSASDLDLLDKAIKASVEPSALKPQKGGRHLTAAQ